MVEKRFIFHQILSKRVGRNANSDDFGTSVTDSDGFAQVVLDDWHLFSRAFVA